MKRYKINEIFYSLQGEGFYCGTPSIFIRFSGCNLQCPFCDTLHDSGTIMTVEEILQAISPYPSRHTVLTGGEPSLFITPELVKALHDQNKFIAIETNGTVPVLPGIDWITLSPKSDFVPEAEIRQKTCDELKAIYTEEGIREYPEIQARHHFVQPCDTGDAEKNRKILASAIAWCKSHPRWRLSLQQHKIIGIH